MELIKSNNVSEVLNFVLNKVSDPQFWINKFKSLSYIDIATLLTITLYPSSTILITHTESIRVVKNILKKYLVVDLQEVNDSIAYVQQYIADICDKSKDPESHYDKYINQSDFIPQLSNKLHVNLEFKKHFQNEEFVMAVLNAFRTIDKRLKKQSLKESPNHTTVYYLSQKLPINTLPQSINYILFFRRGLYLILEALFVDYENVPLSVVEKIVSIAKDRASTYGSRRLMSTILFSLSAIPSNSLTIAKGNGVTILKYFDHLQFLGRQLEYSALNNIFDNIRNTGIPRNYFTATNTKDYQLFIQELKRSKKEFIKTSIVDVGILFSFSYYKTRNVLISAASTAYLSIFFLLNPAPGIINTLYTYGVVLFVPNWVSQIALSAFFRKVVRTYKEYTLKITTHKANLSEQMIPSAHIILNSKDE